MASMVLCQRLDNCFNVPGKRWILLIAGIIELFFFGGYHYGYNALIKPYKDINVFRHLCIKNQTECDAQVKMFNYASIVWVLTQMCLITGAGFIMDRFGLRLLKLIAVGTYFVGSLLFAFTNASTGWFIFPAGIFVALGSTSTMICNHQISSKFPRFRGFVISLMSGAFDSSTVVTFIIAKTCPYISLKTSLVIIAMCSLTYGTLLALFGLTQWSSGMNVEDKPNTLEEKNEDKEFRSMEQVDPDARIQRIIATRFRSLRQCLCSVPFFLVTLWFAFGLLRFQLFLNRIGQLLDYRFGSDKDLIDQLLPVSSALLMAGFAIAPISGLILDASRTVFRRIIGEKMTASVPGTDQQLYRLHLCGMAPAFLVMAVSATLMSALTMSKSVGAFYASFVALVVLRSLLFSASISFVLIAFPIEHFGTVNGIVNTIGGIFGLIQYGLLEFSPQAGNAVGLVISLVLFVSPILMLSSALVRK